VQREYDAVAPFEDTARLAVCLASDESGWVTGQNHSVDRWVAAGFR
jgi:hypothetical protein